MNRTAIFLALLALLPTGCADWERGAYEGLRKREEITTPPGQQERTAPPQDYDTYKRKSPEGPGVRDKHVQSHCTTP